MNPLQRIKAHMDKPLTEDEAMLYMLVMLCGVVILLLAAVITLTATGVIK